MTKYERPGQVDCSPHQFQPISTTEYDLREEARRTLRLAGTGFKVLLCRDIAIFLLA